MSRVQERERECVCVVRPRSQMRTHKRRRKGKGHAPIEAHTVLIRERRENRKKRTNPRTDRRLDGSRARMFVGQSRGVKSTRKGKGEMGQNDCLFFNKARHGAFILGVQVTSTLRSKMGKLNEQGAMVLPATDRMAS